MNIFKKIFSLISILNGLLIYLIEKASLKFFKESHWLGTNV